MFLHLTDVSETFGSRLNGQGIQKLFNWAVSSSRLVKEDLPGHGSDDNFIVIFRQARGSQRQYRVRRQRS